MHLAQLIRALAAMLGSLQAGETVTDQQIKDLFEFIADNFDIGMPKVTIDHCREYVNVHMALLSTFIDRNIGQNCLSDRSLNVFNLVAALGGQLNFVTNAIFEMSTVGVCLAGGESIANLQTNLSRIDTLVADMLGPHPLTLVDISTRMALAAALHTHRLNIIDQYAVPNPALLQLEAQLKDGSGLHKDEIDAKLKACFVHHRGWDSYMM